MVRRNVRPRIDSPEPSVVRLLASLAVLFVAACAGAEEAGRVTTIEQRDSTGAVRIERQVRLNAQGDFENHGTWRAWSPQGELTGQGRYASGKRTGVWRRWADADALPPATGAITRGFAPPFVSQATYRDGLLQGAWTITDSENRTVLEIAFEAGDRHGAATVYDSTGAVVRRSRFDQGVPKGGVERRTPSGELATITIYHAGREVMERTERFENGSIRSQQQMLGPVVKLATPDDPWSLKLATYAQHGDNVRHGERIVWHPNGQVQMRARFAMGKPVGEIRWWRASGQLAAGGSYQNGAASGEWRWLSLIHI